MKIIGIDPGLSDTGVGIVEGIGHTVERYSYGGIRTSNRISLPERLDRIFSRLTTLLQQETPDLLVIEEVFSLQRYPKSGITLGQVSGVILLAGFRCGMPAVAIPVREAKQVLTGNGNATKTQLETAVRHLLGSPSPIRPYHASDALGLAIIGLLRCTGARRSDSPHNVDERFPEVSAKFRPNGPPHSNRS